MAVGLPPFAVAICRANPRALVAFVGAAALFNFSAALAERVGGASWQSQLLSLVSISLLFNALALRPVGFGSRHSSSLLAIPGNP